MSLIFLYLLIVVVLIFGSACFSGFENGILGIRKPRLDQGLANGSTAAKFLKRFLDRPSNMLATILLGNNLCNSFIAIYFDLFVKEIHNAWWFSAIASGVLTILLLVFGELTPKVWFRQKPYVRCRIFVLPMYTFYIMTWPLVRALTLFVDLLERFIPRKGGHGEVSPALMREDFRTMLLESEEQNLMDPEARQLLDNALDYHNTRVRDQMVSRAETVSLHAGMTLADAVNFAQLHGHSRFPVRQSEQETSPWIGTLSVYDAYFRVPRDKWASESLRNWIRPAVTVRDSAALNYVLTLSRNTRSPMLIVIDAKNRQTGVVTPTDVVGPLFGDLEI